MYISPRYKELTGRDPAPNPLATQKRDGHATAQGRHQAVAEQGPQPERLVTFDRTKRGQNPEELRIELCEYQGRPYVGLRVWYRSADGSYLPSKKGITIRVGELDDASEALLAAARIVESRQAGE